MAPFLLVRMLLGDIGGGYPLIFLFSFLNFLPPYHAQYLRTRLRPIQLTLSRLLHVRLIALITNPAHPFSSTDVNGILGAEVYGASEGCNPPDDGHVSRCGTSTPDFLIYYSLYAPMRGAQSLTRLLSI